MLRYVKMKSVVRVACVLFVLGVAATTSTPANTQGRSINYDDLSFLEEPLAVEMAGFTLRYSQLIDVPITIDFQEKSESLAGATVFEFNLERQLSNAITIGGNYAGLFDGTIEDSNDKYSDAWAAYAGGVWGTMHIGHVTGQVRENTRRFRGVGNAALALDDFIGKADDVGLGYEGRQSAFVGTAGVDKDGRYDLGVSYRRPSKYIDHHFTVRHVSGAFRTADRGDEIESRGYGAVGEIVYGSMLIDVGAGYEEFDGRLDGQHRQFVSAGISYKLNAVSFSAEGHLGEIADGKEFSYAIGGRLDFARGASLNVGYNYSDIDAPFLKEHGETSKLLISLRYEY